MDGNSRKRSRGNDWRGGGRGGGRGWQGGRGRGRGGMQHDAGPPGRGRGRSMVMPAWMKNQQSGGSQPDGPGGPGGSPGPAPGSAGHYPPSRADTSPSAQGYGGAGGGGPPTGGPYAAAAAAAGTTDRRGGDPRAAEGGHYGRSGDYSHPGDRDHGRDFDRNRDRDHDRDRDRDYHRSNDRQSSHPQHREPYSGSAAAASNGNGYGDPAAGHNQQPQAPPPVDPPGTRVGRWTAQIDPNSQSIFYWDPVTRQSQWERPRQPAQPPPISQLRPLPGPEWVEVLDENTGRFYLWNEKTDAVAWRVEDIK